ncbi:hypothetical protein DFP72DRAFT_1065667 [Ephemerocybe angulata]|uniref:Uncharacterized protein n=1 Tax=Ephemerocybe angulata TaxID=980116 RepID=A0A8H6M9T2_9AGAR|nr:hypothetical protein DFP72DRAFT_1065667 [Tulosesus angulatus]
MKNSLYTQYSDIPSVPYSSDGEKRMKNMQDSTPIPRRSTSGPSRPLKPQVDENRYHRYNKPKAQQMNQKRRRDDSSDTGQTSSTIIPQDNQQILKILGDLEKVKKDVRATNSTIQKIETSVGSLQEGLQEVIKLMRTTQAAGTQSQGFTVSVPEPNGEKARLRLWTREDWNKLSSSEQSATVIKVAGATSARTQAKQDPKFYIVQKDGTPVPAERLELARKIVRAKFQGKWGRNGKPGPAAAPLTAGAFEYSIIVEITNAVEEEVVEVAYAASHWKARHLMTELYPKFHSRTVIPLQAELAAAEVKTEPNTPSPFVKVEPGLEGRPAKKSRTASAGVSGMFKTPSTSSFANSTLKNLIAQAASSSTAAGAAAITPTASGISTPILTPAPSFAPTPTAAATPMPGSFAPTPTAAVTPMPGSFAPTPTAAATPMPGSFAPTPTAAATPMPGSFAPTPTAAATPMPGSFAPTPTAAATPMPGSFAPTPTAAATPMPGSFAPTPTAAATPMPGSFAPTPTAAATPMPGSLAPTPTAAMTPRVPSPDAMMIDPELLKLAAPAPAVKNPLEGMAMNGISRFLQPAAPPSSDVMPPVFGEALMDPADFPQIIQAPASAPIDPAALWTLNQPNREYKPKAFGKANFVYQDYYGAEWAPTQARPTRGGWADAWNALPLENKKAYLRRYDSESAAKTNGRKKKESK